MSNTNLSEEERIRYSRHLMLPEMGREGQLKLKKAKVLIVGAGGLGSPAAMYLVAAGTGTIGIVDFDKVELSNLQRQVLFSEKDIGKPKVSVIKGQLKKINYNAKITIHDEKLTSKNAMEIMKNYDLVIDGSDNFPTRYLVNDACVLLKKPLVYGSVYRFDGQASVFNYKGGPCYRCLFPNPPNVVLNCAEAGVLGVLPGIIGMIQATETIKIILRKGNVLSKRLLVYNALSMAFLELNAKKNKNCLACGENAKIKELIDYDTFCNSENKEEITVKDLKKMIDNNEDFVLVDVREEVEQEICKIEDAKLVSFSDLVKNNFSFFDNFDKNKKIVLYCHVGTRSGFITGILRKKGYDSVNLVGGIDAWAKEIDKEIRVY